METRTIIVPSDTADGQALKRMLARIIRSSITEALDEASALSLIRSSENPVEYVIAPWGLGDERRRFVSDLRALPQGRSTYHFAVASVDDFEWLRPTIAALNTFGELFGDTTRIAHFLNQVQQLINPAASVKSSVLLVDDDTEARKIIRNYLTGFGFAHISEATNGNEALTLLEQNPGAYSLVISDWQMPEMTGLELLKKVRSLPEMSRVAFVMVTSKTPIEQIKTIQAADFGVNGYILKPFTMKSFHSQLDAVLNDIARHRTAEAFLVAGRTLLAQGNHMGAESVFKEAFVQFPDHPQMLEAMGDAYASRFNDPKALPSAAEYFERALGKSPYNAGLFIKCFEAYTALGRMNDAVRLLKAHKPRSNSDDAFRTRIGKIYLQNGYPELAVVEFDHAIAVNPENSEAKALQRLAESSSEKKNRKAS